MGKEKQELKKMNRMYRREADKVINEEVKRVVKALRKNKARMVIAFLISFGINITLITLIVILLIMNYQK